MILINIEVQEAYNYFAVFNNRRSVNDGNFKNVISPVQNSILVQEYS